MRVRLATDPRWLLRSLWLRGAFFPLKSENAAETRHHTDASCPAIYCAAETITCSYVPVPSPPGPKISCCEIHSRERLKASSVYGSHTMRSPGPQRLVSIIAL